MEELQTRHRKEQRELQSRITQKKKNATKKTRKGVNDECERFERELQERQKAEVDALDGKDSGLQPGHQAQIEDEEAPSTSEAEVGKNEDKKVTFSSATPAEDEQPQEQQSKQKKPNRQKARLARRAAEQEAEAAAAAEEAANQPDLRQQELTSMKTEMDRLGLKETFVRPDGHCLYSACALGLPSTEVQNAGPSTKGYQNLRYATANFISSHPDDFAAFLEEPIDSYTKKIKDTAEWGGQLELQAIARTFNVKIKVLQASGRIEEISSEDSNTADRELWLAYYRHSFGLGEHYNALQKITNA